MFYVISYPNETTMVMNCDADAMNVGYSYDAKRNFIYRQLYTPWVKKGDTILLCISLLNIDRLSQFFHRRTQLELCNKIINKDPNLTSDDLILSYEISLVTSTSFCFDDFWVAFLPVMFCRPMTSRTNVRCPLLSALLTFGVVCQITIQLILECSIFSWP